MNQTYKYEFVLSFAGQNRNVVEKVRDHLRDHNMRVFYDYDEQHDLLGKDLAEHFSELYQNAGQFCVIFVSQAYVERAWCKWERRAALARAFSSKKEYIIPYVIEDVHLPGIPETIGSAHHDKIPPAVFATLLMRKLRGLAETPEGHETATLTTQLVNSLSINRTSTVEEEPSSNRRLTTEFGDVDQLLGTNLRRRAIYGIASRPYVGKTAFALNMALRLAHQNIPVAYVTVDAPMRSVVQRLLAITSKVPIGKLSAERRDKRQIRQIAEAYERLRALPLRIIDTGDNTSLDVIICELWAAVATLKIRAFIIDSLHSINSAYLFHKPITGGPSRALSSLKWLAQETNTTGLVLLRLSRNLEMRVDKTPIAADIYGGKAITSWLEALFLLHRPEIYDPDTDDKSLNVFVAPSGRSQRRGPARLTFRSTNGWVSSLADWKTYLPDGAVWWDTFEADPDNFDETEQRT